MPSRVKSKISSTIQRIASRDIESQESRELFLGSLPDYLFSTVGGNTACVEVLTNERCRFIFDAGTGIRELGNEILATQRPADCHLFFSHFHWDHIQGLPFFGPAFDPRNSITFYSPVPELKSILEGQMKPPYFPISMDMMSSAKDFRVLLGDPVAVGGVRVSYRAMNHPGGCFSYAIEEGGVRAIYSTDTELREEDFRRTPENMAYFQDADILVMDTQYTLGEAMETYNWGHSSFSLASDFAATWGIKRLMLFHHEPSNSDLRVESIFKSASWYIEYLESKGIKVFLAREGLDIEV